MYDIVRCRIRAARVFDNLTQNKRAVFPSADMDDNGRINMSKMRQRTQVAFTFDAKSRNAGQPRGPKLDGKSDPTENTMLSKQTINVHVEASLSIFEQ